MSCPLKLDYSSKLHLINQLLVLVDWNVFVAHSRKFVDLLHVGEKCLTGLSGFL